jgi:hypothetical protein
MHIQPKLQLSAPLPVYSDSPLWPNVFLPTYFVVLLEGRCLQRPSHVTNGPRERGPSKPGDKTKRDEEFAKKQADLKQRLKKGFFIEPAVWQRVLLAVGSCHL